jgi:TatD DNase family protein
MIDTHCHLTFPDFRDRVEAELAEAAAHGVTGCITISTSSRDCGAALEIASRHSRVWSTSGVHPLYTGEGPHDWDEIVRCARSARCVAWGELGLDNHYPEPSAAVQRRVLADQLAVIESCRSGAGEPGLGKPVVIHCREAFDDLIPILSASSVPGDRFVFHCFTGTPEEASRVLDLGAMISLTGVVTYANAKELQRAAASIPADRLVCETDAPYLAPMPRRGERPCRPWMVSLTARFLAELRGESFEVFSNAIDANTRRFFGINTGTAT